MIVPATRPQPRRRAGTAIEMYRGGCVPMLCSRYAGLPEYQTRIRLLSAAHGVLYADALVTDDEVELTDQRIAELQPSVIGEFTYEFSIRGVPRDLIVAVEPAHAQRIGTVLHVPDRIPHTLTTLTPADSLPDISQRRDEWGWP